MDTIQLTVGSTTLVLHGAGVTGAMRGARLLPAGGPGPTVEERIELVLEGTAGEIETALESACRLVQLARQAADGAGGYWGYLEVKLTAAGATWRSKIVDGWPEYQAAGAGQRARGRQGAVLRLVRENWWEGPEVSLPLSNPHGTNVTTGLTVYNHEDAAHKNYADVAAASLAGDLPAPARLEISASTAETGTVWVGLNQNSAPADLAVNYPGEVAAAGSGITGSNQADATYASGGSYKRFTWSGAGSKGVAGWSLNALSMARMGGRAFRGVLRFYSAVVESNLWASWRLVYSGAATETIWEGPGQYLSTAMVVQDLPGLRLPPWVIPPGDNPPGLLLELVINAAGAGSHVLDIDELYLLPMDGWRKYEPAILQVAGLALRDDTERESVQALSTALQSHAADGPGFWLEPGKAARFTFLVGQRLLANIALTATVKVFYRPRKRGL